MKKLTLSIIAIGISVAAFAQDAAQATGGADPHLFQKIMTTSIFIIGGLIVLAAVLMLLRLSEALSKNIVNEYLLEQGKISTSTAISTVQAPKKKTWLQRLTDAVPVEKQDEIAFDHAFDGIRELDNKLPPWWVGMFYITIIIGVVYFSYYEVLGLGDSSSVQYKKEMAQAEEAKKLRLAALGSQIDENSVTLADAAGIEAGKAEFVAKCAACHLADGGGIVGPNLTDKYWLHGGSLKDVFKTIKYGVPAKGMIAWESQLTPVQIQNVASFIMSLQGTTPATPKDPQGELYVEENTTAPTDTTTKTEEKTTEM
jgi:cytochrome c oxidase cbb3-type subunit III